jgi:hypothetical protein
MLVLALQFSKGNGRGRRLDVSSNRALRGQRERSSMPCAEGRQPKWVDSLKTEEKTKLVEPACQEERILRLTCHFD